MGCGASDEAGATAEDIEHAKRKRSLVHGRESAFRINTDITLVDEEGRTLSTKARAKDARVSKRKQNPTENFEGHYGPVVCVWSVNDTVLSGSKDNTAYRWHYDSKSQAHSCKSVIDGHKNPITAICTNEEALWLGCKDGSVSCRMPGKPPSVLFVQVHVTALYPSHNEDLVYVGMDDGDVQVLDGFRGDTVGTPLRAHPGASLTAMFQSEDKKSLVTCGSDGTIRMRALQKNGKFDKAGETQRVDGHEGGVACMHKFADKSCKFVTGGNNGEIKLWDHSTGPILCLKTIPAHSAKILSVVPTPAGEIVSCSEDLSVKCFTQDGECTGALTGRQVNGLAVNSKLNIIYLACEDKTVKSWVLDPFQGGKMTGLPAPEA